jgi:hypothetical protein
VQLKSRKSTGVQCNMGVIVTIIIIITTMGWELISCIGRPPVPLLSPRVVPPRCNFMSTTTTTSSAPDDANIKFARVKNSHTIYYEHKIHSAKTVRFPSHVILLRATTRLPYCLIPNCNCFNVYMTACIYQLYK